MADPTGDILKIIKDLESRVSILERMPITSLKLGASGVLVVPVVTADPSTPEDGQVWYNSTSDTFKCVQNGVVKTFTTS